RGGGQSDERQPECRDSSGNPKIACVHLRPFLLALRRGRGEIVRRSSAAQSNGFPHSPCGGEWELRPRPVCRAFLADAGCSPWLRSEEHTSELQSRGHLVCRLLLEKKKQLRL